MVNPPKALTVGAFGARGTGKTAWIVQYLEKLKPKRLLIWDYKDDPPIEHLGRAVYTLPELARLAQDPTFRLRYVVDHSGPSIHEQFERFCMVAWFAGNLDMYVAELPEVTKANKAPPTWRRCVNVGRSYRLGGLPKSLGILADGQRMAEIDKSFISNLDIVHSGRLNDLADAKRMANTLGVKYSEILALPDLHYIEKRADTPQATRGILKFTKKIAAPRR